MTGQSETRTIGEVARAIGVSTTTNRAWEVAGLVAPARDAKGNRRYSDNAQRTLQEIKHLRDRDRLPLDELRRRLQGPGSLSPAAPDHAKSRVADRLKMLRRTLGLSLRAVSARTGISASHINAIERGYSEPSVASLITLAQAYGVNVLSFFDEDSSEARHVVRRGEGDVIGTGSFGVSMTLLSPRASALELHLFHLAPGAGSGGDYHHEGTECFYVLEGKLGVWLGSDDFHELADGDCLCFPSTIEHRWANLADTTTSFLGANTPPTF
jgi:DNA-binding transcriptional MerR regulator/quercetin dioxygenase-like cupin family protein